MNMKNPYLYLETMKYAENWINGEKIPIKLASCYRKNERNGIYTPDENIISSLNQPMPEYQMVTESSPILKTFGVFGMDSTGKRGKMQWSDGYILSFCREKSKIIKNRLGKKICVQINDIF